MKAILNLLGMTLYLLCIFKCYRSSIEKVVFIFPKARNNFRQKIPQGRSICKWYIYPIWWNV